MDARPNTPESDRLDVLVTLVGFSHKEAQEARKSAETILCLLCFFVAFDQSAGLFRISASACNRVESVALLLPALFSTDAARSLSFAMSAL
jgi:hypothetical protein